MRGRSYAPTEIDATGARITRPGEFFESSFRECVASEQYPLRVKYPKYLKYLKYLKYPFFSLKCIGIRWLVLH